jgi:hypothetical protein
MDNELWKELPQDILIVHILSRLDIDTRISLKVKPMKIDKKIIENFEKNCKIQIPIINYCKIDERQSLTEIEMNLELPNGKYLIQFFISYNFEEIYVIKKRAINGDIVQIFILKYNYALNRITSRAHVIRSE